MRTIFNQQASEMCFSHVSERNTHAYEFAEGESFLWQICEHTNWTNADADGTVAARY